MENEDLPDAIPTKLIKIWWGGRGHFLLLLKTSKISFRPDWSGFLSQKTESLFQQTMNDSSRSNRHSLQYI